ncbi:hypothetical protein Cylst_3389 [Cylindrospermum stagnale PCC 7417]|uniref:Uncharacterized protein n=2 Tax=Cylindrospermum stagnale TaxID=142864 RepID=K9X0E0_9NOST|nr:hypothetical protein Cylst_3389 [Cylindrospermum stagnale PCC 7417]
MLRKFFFFGITSTLILTACTLTQFPSANPDKARAENMGEMKTSKGKKDTAEDLMYEAKINERVTINGSARNAMLGAIVKTSDNTPIYIDGISEWESKILGKSIVVTGVLRLRKLAPNPEVGPNGEQSHGIKGDSYILENSTWTVDK